MDKKTKKEIGEFIENAFADTQTRFALIITKDNEPILLTGYSLKNEDFEKVDQREKFLGWVFDELKFATVNALVEKEVKNERKENKTKS